MSQAQVDADASLARTLAEQEAARSRIYEAERRAGEWENYYSTRLYPYYYGSWRPAYRPVVVYRHDSTWDICFVSCFFFWIIALFITIILVVYYTGG